LYFHLFSGKGYLADLYNQFFGTIGMSIQLDVSRFLVAVAGISGMALHGSHPSGMRRLVSGKDRLGFSCTPFFF